MCWIASSEESAHNFFQELETYHFVTIQAQHLTRSNGIKDSLIMYYAISSLKDLYWLKQGLPFCIILERSPINSNFCERMHQPSNYCKIIATMVFSHLGLKQFIYFFNNRTDSSVRNLQLKKSFRKPFLQ